MSRRLLAVAVMTTLVATGTNPSYCAAMLAASTEGASGRTASAPVTPDGPEHHHHHASGLPASGEETRQIGTGAATCSNCGGLTVRAVTPDGRAKLMVTPQSESSLSHLAVSLGQRSSASGLPSNSITPPLLTPLRI